jgi:D-alanine-D-alanine ligase
MSRFDAGREHAMAPPYVVKPVAEGSSVGVLIVTGEHAHPPQELFSDEWPYGDHVMVERFIPGRELTCAVMGDTVLGVTEIVPAEALRFYNYEAKYAQGGSRHILPAPLQSNIYELVQKLTLMAHRALGCRGVSRADFRYDDTPGGSGEIVCLEVNTQPGMTATSLVPELAAHAGMSFAELVSWMVEEASCNR